MKKVKSAKSNFLNDFKNSCLLNRKFFKDLVDKPISYSVIYFIKLILFLSLITVIFFLIKVNLLFGFKYFDSLIGNALSLPNNLIITIKNNTLTTNQNRPIFLWSSNTKNGQLFSVIDETASEEKIKDYNSLILLTSKNIVLNNKTNIKPVLIPYNSQYLKITKNEIVQVANIIKKFFPFIATFIFFLLIIFAPIGIFIGYIISTAILSLIIHLIFKLSSTKHKYLKTFQIALHSSSLPIVLSILIPINSAVSFLNFLFIIIAVYNVYLFKKQKKTS